MIYIGVTGKSGAGKTSFTDFWDEKSNVGDIVDFIFVKDASMAKYDSVLVEDKYKCIPQCIKHLINDSFYYNDTTE